MKNTNTEISPDNIMQLGSAFWVSKVFLSAVELGVFTELAKGPQSLANLQKKLGLQQRGARDFFDALVSVKLLKRTGDTYQNTPDTDVFLDKNKNSYIGGIFEMQNARLWDSWGKLTTALKTGKSQSAMSDAGDLFGSLYSDPVKLKGFLTAMTGVSLGVAKVIAQKFPWKNYKTFYDIGGAQGAVPVQVALAHKHMTGGSWDLAPVKPVFEEYVKHFELQDRLKFTAGDFFKENLPKADVLVFGHILHDWGMKDKMMLLKKAHAALNPGGAIIVYEALIDDDRSQNTFGLLMSLNMLLETPDGFDYTGADCVGWMKEVGFKDIRVEHLVGPNSMVVGIK